MIVGATPDSDKDILRLSSALYQRPTMKRVYYSGFIPVNEYDNRLPALKQRRWFGRTSVSGGLALALLSVQSG